MGKSTKRGLKATAATATATAPPPLATSKGRSPSPPPCLPRLFGPKWERLADADYEEPDVFNRVFGADSESETEAEDPGEGGERREAGERRETPREKREREEAEAEAVAARARLYNLMWIKSRMDEEVARVLRYDLGQDEDTWSANFRMGLAVVGMALAGVAHVFPVEDQFRQGPTLRKNVSWAICYAYLVALAWFVYETLRGPWYSIMETTGERAAYVVTRMPESYGTKYDVELWSVRDAKGVRVRRSVDLVDFYAPSGEIDAVRVDELVKGLFAEFDAACRARWPSSSSSSATMTATTTSAGRKKASNTGNNKKQ